MQAFEDPQSTEPPKIRLYAQHMQASK